MMHRRAAIRAAGVWMVAPGLGAAAPGATSGGTSSASVDPMAALQAFQREARTGSTEFTQTVFGPDGVRKRVSSGVFEFSRPDRFRFEYRKPFAQLIIADGQRLWVYDPDLQQAVARRQAQALESTPIAFLAGSDWERSVVLTAEPVQEGLSWVKAVPRRAGGAFEWLRLGFQDRQLVRMELLDPLGQRSVLEFHQLRLNVPLPADRMRFVPPKGVDVIEQ